jgi:tetratricopeptide (TPR) repeat protein
MSNSFGQQVPSEKRKTRILTALRHWMDNQYTMATEIFSNLLQYNTGDMQDLIFWAGAAVHCGAYDKVFLTLNMYIEKPFSTEQKFFKFLVAILLAYCSFKLLEDTKFDFSTSKGQLYYQTMVKSLTADTAVLHYNMAAYLLALLNQKRMNHTKAIEVLSHVILRDPKHCAALLCRAESNLVLRNFREAQFDIQRVLNFFPTSTVLKNLNLELEKIESF